MAYQGCYATGSTIYWIFGSTVNGVPTSLSGSPAVSIYDSTTTESTAGVTLTTDFDGITGMNQVSIDTTADDVFYAAGTQFSAVISSGTLGGQSVVGLPVGSFDIEAEVVAGVVGNVTGNITGNFNGDIIGNVDGTVQGVIDGKPKPLSPGIRSPFGV